MRPLGIRFWEKADRSGGPDACWLWTAVPRNTGYGRLNVGGRAGRNEGAHRIGWTLSNGPIPEGECVLHRCDVPMCVNPGHLFLGNRKINHEDMIAKGRDRHACGEDSGAAKLTGSEVLDIRRLHALEGLGYKRLAKRFGVSARTTGAIIKRKAWTHIAEEAV